MREENKQAAHNMINDPATGPIAIVRLLNPSAEGDTKVHVVADVDVNSDEELIYFIQALFHLTSQVAHKGADLAKDPKASIMCKKIGETSEHLLQGIGQMERLRQDTNSGKTDGLHSIMDHILDKLSNDPSVPDSIKEHLKELQKMKEEKPNEEDPLGSINSNTIDNLIKEVFKDNPPPPESSEEDSVL